MKAKIMGRTIEIPDERLKVRGACPQRSQASAPVKDGGLCIPSPVNHAPSPYAFTLFGKMKSGKNHIQITRKGRRYPKPEFVEWRTKMLAQMPKIKQPFVGPVKVFVQYAPGDRLRRDAPGMQDALLHLFEKHGVVLDDAQVKDIHWKEMPLDRKNPRCVVIVERVWP